MTTFEFPPSKTLLLPTTKSAVESVSTGQSKQRKRLRRLCNSRDHPLRLKRLVVHQDVASTRFGDDDEYDCKREEQLLRKVRKLDPRRPGEMTKILTLARQSRKRGFVRDPRIVTGDVRDSEHNQYNLATLIFEIVRRSSSKANTWEECRNEWDCNADVGIMGWTCVGGKTWTPDVPDSVTAGAGARTVWLDDPLDDSWIEGQCLCLQTRCGTQGNDHGHKKASRAIKYRYSIKNRVTDDVVTLGSTCIQHWNKKFIADAKANYGWAVHTVKPGQSAGDSSSSSSSASAHQRRAGKKWCFV